VPTRPPARRTVRLRRSNCGGPGVRRVRHGRGFSYLAADGKRVTSAATRRRIAELAIPPAWREVWICPDPRGHLQATGLDAAGRKQYLYHDDWRRKRDREKFARMIDFAGALPRLRRRVAAALDRDSEGLSRERVLAGAVALLDLGLFRIGNEEYAAADGGLGLSTLGLEHVAFKDGAVVFDYPGKSGVRHVQRIEDAACVGLIRELKRRRGGRSSLFAYRDERRWVALRSDDVNDYIKVQMGEGFSAKDFRTWNATVVAAVTLAAQGGGADTKAARKRAVDGAVRQVAEVLGNTPAVARRAYIDQRVIDRYLSGWTIAGALPRRLQPGVPGVRLRSRLERAVLDLLADDRESRALERIS
jgi:DNA topoisomerase-1